MTVAKRNAFINGQGLSSKQDFALFTAKDAPHIVKMHNQSAQANHKLGFLISRNIEALIYYVCDHMCQQLPLVAANWTAATMQSTIQEMQIEAAILDSDNAPYEYP